MDTLHHQDVVLFQVHHLSLEEGPSLLEVVTRQLHLPARKKGVQVIAQQFQVHGLQGLEIVVAVIVLGRKLPCHKVVVQLYHLGIHAHHLQLLGHPEGGRGFSAGGRTGQENNLYPVPLGIDFIGQAGVFPFLAGLTEVDEFYGFPIQEALVQSAYAHDAGGLAPVSVFLEGNGQFLLLQAGNHPGNILLHGMLQAETVVERHQVKDFQVSRRRDQRAIEVVRNPVQAINRPEVPAQGADYAGFQALVLPLKELDGFGGQHLVMGERKVQGYQAPHFFPHPEDILIRDTLCPELAIHAAGQGMVNLEYLFREQVAGCHLGQETERTGISAASFRMVVTYEFYLVREENLEIQGFELVVHQGGQYGIHFPGLGVRNLPGGETAQRGTGGDGLHPAVVRNLYLNIGHILFLS